MSDSDDPIGKAAFHYEIAYYTYKSLERMAALASVNGEMEAAAGYANAFWYLAEEMPYMFSDYADEAGDIPAGIEEMDDGFLGHGMMKIYEWAQKNEHPVVEYFDEGRESVGDDWQEMDEFDIF